MIVNIQEKLKEILSKRSSLDEVDVVYLLVQISKYFERVKEDVEGKINFKTDFPTIIFFRDWVVHGILDKRRSFPVEILWDEDNQWIEKKIIPLFQKLIEEINNTQFISIPKELQISFQKSLFKVIKDIPVIGKL